MAQETRTENKQRKHAWGTNGEISRKLSPEMHSPSRGIAVRSRALANPHLSGRLIRQCTSPYLQPQLWCTMVSSNSLVTVPMVFGQMKRHMPSSPFRTSVAQCAGEPHEVHGPGGAFSPRCQTCVICRCLGRGFIGLAAAALLEAVPFAAPLRTGADGAVLTSTGGNTKGWRATRRNAPMLLDVLTPDFKSSAILRTRRSWLTSISCFSSMLRTHATDSKGRWVQARSGMCYFEQERVTGGGGD
jgi:hypothetical protein